MQAAIGTSVRMGVAEAAREAVQQAVRRLGGRAPDAMLVVATGAWGVEHLAALAQAVAAEARCTAMAGGTVDAVLAGEGWVAHRPGLAVLALSGVDARALHVEALDGDEGRGGRELAAHLPGPFGPEDLLVLFADGLSLSPAPLLAGLAEALPGLAIVGVGASEPAGGLPRVWAGSDSATRACSALLLRSLRPPALAVTQGCRRLGPVLEVTRSRGHWVVGLDGRPALDALDDVAAASAPAGAAAPWLIGLLDGSDADDPLAAPIIRRVVGQDPVKRSIALPESVRVGTRVVRLVVDPDAAEQDVAQRLRGAVAAREPGWRAACGLYLTCGGSGDVLLEAATRSRALADALGGAPLLGIASAYQIAPRASGGAPARLHTHSGVIALLG